MSKFGRLFKVFQEFVKNPKMGTVHLAKGSTIPPKEAGKLRLYSMKFCPYVQRVLIVLAAKNVPHDVINVNLQNKPTWLYDLHPQGKVPVLDIGDKILIESLNICDYLDGAYPEPPLYPKNPEGKIRDVLLIQKLEEFPKFFFRIVRNKHGKSLSEHVKDVTPLLEECENELAKRGAFFGGERPGMVDYLIWPWVERASVIDLLYEGSIPDGSFARLRSWSERLRNDDAVRNTVIDVERHFKFVQSFLTPQAPIAYDSI